VVDYIYDVGCNHANRIHCCPFRGFFLGNLLGKFSKESSIKKYILNFSLYYFVRVCIKIVPKICRFQSFQSPFTIPFIALKNGYMDITFEGPNLNEIFSYFGNL